MCASLAPYQKRYLKIDNLETLRVFEKLKNELRSMILDIIFLICSLAAVILAVLMVTQKNPIYSALYLIGVFFPLAVLFLLLWAPFVAIIQILVYAGAIMVLFMFVIMMINLENKELEIEKPKLFKISAAIAAVAFIAVGFFTVLKTVLPMSKQPVDIPDSFGSTEAMAQLMFTDYLIHFELIGVLILVALVGAVVLGKRQLD